MSRRVMREQLFKLLFRVEFNSLDEMGEQCQLYFEDSENQVAEKDMKEIEEKLNHILEHLTEIDEKINEKSEGWSTGRMGKVDLTIIRLAVYEILYDEDVPANVAINEAVELAKKFGQDASYGFVNGVLAKFV